MHQDLALCDNLTAAANVFLGRELRKGVGPFRILDYAAMYRRAGVNLPHNFEKDNRQALYSMIGDFFYKGDKGFDAKEIPCDKEVKKADDLHVELPKDSATFNSLARDLAKSLPRDGELPAAAGDARAWQAAKRKELRDVLRLEDFDVEATQAGGTAAKETTATLWKLRVGKRFRCTREDL